MSYVSHPTKTQKKEWEEQARQQEEQMRAMVKNLAESYQEKPENLAELLAFGSRFYRYSVRNNMVIYSQNPHATYVQSFKAWKDMGYPPKKGEHGLKVYVPVQATILKVGNDLVPLEQASKEQKLQYQAGKIESTTRNRFKLGTVFDIAQTMFPKEKYPQIFHMGYPSALHKGLADGLADYAKQALGCKVETKDMRSIALRGQYDRSRHAIILNGELEDTQRLSTLAHELGHAMLHRQGESRTAAQIEMEADALGIMVESYMGIEPTESRKRHLAENFRQYREEYRVNPDRSEPFGLVLKNVYQAFKGCEEEIALAIGKKVPTSALQKEGQKKEMPDELPPNEVYGEMKRQIQITDYAAMHGFTVTRTGRYYTLKEHDSVRIDPERNCFWRNSGIDLASRQALAANASGSIIDFSAMFVHGGDLHEALGELGGMIHTAGHEAVTRKAGIPKATKEPPKKTLGENLPKRAANMKRAFAYLTKSRYIGQEVVQDFVDRKMLYQDEKGNCIFVAYGKDGSPNFATFRGTLTEKRFLGDIPGNDYARGFYIENGSDKVIVTESVIDAMSVMTILQGQGTNYHDYNYLAGAGTGKSAALLTHLKEKPQAEALLSMDHDVAGISAMAGLKREIGRLGGQTKVTYHVPGIERNDWNGELAYAAKKLLPMDGIPYLENQPLPKIRHCAVQSTEQMEEKGFRRRGEKHQYRLVEKKDGIVQPMDINRNVIYTDPKELMALVSPMYVLADYKLMEGEGRELEGPAHGQKEAQKPAAEAEPAPLSVKGVSIKDGICMATVEIGGKEQELGVWKRGGQFYVETGYAFEGTLKEYLLENRADGMVKDCMGNDLKEYPNMLVMEEYHWGGKLNMQGSQDPQAAFLDRIQKQELGKDHSAMVKQPEAAMEM